MRLRYGKIAAGPVFWVVLCFQMCAAGVMARPAFTLLEATQQGVFNIGKAAGRCDRVQYPAFGRTVLQLNYTVPRGTSAGIWVKGFPQRVGSSVPDLLWLRVIVPGTIAPENVTATVELKGAKATQQIPLRLEAGENSLPVLIEVSGIGSLNEFVLAISQAGGDQTATGTLLLDCEFQTRTIWQKGADHPGGPDRKRGVVRRVVGACRAHRKPVVRAACPVRTGGGNSLSARQRAMAGGPGFIPG